MSDYDDLVDYVGAYHASSPERDGGNAGCVPLLFALAVAAILLLLLRLLL